MGSIGLRISHQVALADLTPDLLYPLFVALCIPRVVDKPQSIIIHLITDTANTFVHLNLSPLPIMYIYTADTDSLGKGLNTEPPWRPVGLRVKHDALMHHGQNRGSHKNEN